MKGYSVLIKELQAENDKLKEENVELEAENEYFEEMWELAKEDYMRIDAILDTVITAILPFVDTTALRSNFRKAG